jgi:hypothetical protein
MTIGDVDKKVGLSAEVLRAVAEVAPKAFDRWIEARTSGDVERYEAIARALVKAAGAVIIRFPRHGLEIAVADEDLPGYPTFRPQEIVLAARKGPEALLLAARVKAGVEGARVRG